MFDAQDLPCHTPWFAMGWRARYNGWHLDSSLDITQFGKAPGSWYDRWEFEAGHRSADNCFKMAEKGKLI